MSKPLTEVLAGIYCNELSRLRASKDMDSPPWENMDDEARAESMGAMAEVVRTMNAFSIDVVQEDGKIFLQEIERRAPVIELNAAPNMIKADVLDTGRGECPHCGSSYTVPDGSCAICMNCHKSIGGCSG